MVASCSGCAVLVWAAGPSSTMRSASRADLAPFFRLRVKEERRSLVSTEVRGALHFDCVHGSSTSFLWHMGPGGISVQGLFLERQSRFLRFAPALSVSATFSGEPALAHQGPPNPAFAARNAPARKGALAVGERMAQLYGLTCARPGRARRTAEWAFTLKDRISTNVSRETSIAHLW